MAKSALDMFFEQNSPISAHVIKTNKSLNVKQTKKLTKKLNKLRRFYEN